MSTPTARISARIPGTESVFFAALAADSSAGVLVVADDGAVEFANFGAGRLFAKSVDDIVGQPYAALFDEISGRERMDLVRETIRTNEVLTVDGMIHGKMVRCTFRPISAGTGGRPRLVLTSRALQVAAEMELKPEGRYVKAKASDTGALGTLTPRELEIMRLIGLGLSTAAIAKKLHRSVKTIEWHRVSLGTKLGVTNRVELARIAIAAGLVGVGEESETEAKAAKSAT